MPLSSRVFRENSNFLHLKPSNFLAVIEKRGSIFAYLLLKSSSFEYETCVLSELKFEFVFFKLIFSKTYLKLSNNYD